MIKKKCGGRVKPKKRLGLQKESTPQRLSLLPYRHPFLGDSSSTGAARARDDNVRQKETRSPTSALRIVLGKIIRTLYRAISRAFECIADMPLLRDKNSKGTWEGDLRKRPKIFSGKEKAFVKSVL